MGYCEKCRDEEDARICDQCGRALCDRCYGAPWIDACRDCIAADLATLPQTAAPATAVLAKEAEGRTGWTDET